MMVVIYENKYPYPAHSYKSYYSILLWLEEVRHDQKNCHNLKCRLKKKFSRWLSL